MRDFDIVIAHRGDAMGLWLTIHSCEIELANSKYDYRYLICANGEENSKHRCGSDYGSVNVDLARILDFVKKSGKMGFVEVLQESIAPPTARQIATEHSDAKYLFFFDNHCMVNKGYFDRALYSFEKYGMDLLHSTTIFFAGEVAAYEYKLKLESNFWAESANFAKDEYRPYRIAAGGHGGFAVKQDVWREVGGYWKGFKGYGGEEMYFDLKMAMLDKTNYLDPLMVHYHYAGQRGYTRHFTSDFYKNMMMCANLIGGNKWLDKVYESFSTKYPQPKEKPLFETYMEAESGSRQHSLEIAAMQKRTLDEQLKFFRDNDISC